MPHDDTDDALSATLDALAPAPPCAHGPRLYVEGADLADAAEVTLEAPQAHYLRSVMRRGSGDPVVLFNGRDGEWLARLETVAKAKATARCADCLRPQPAGEEADAAPWLLFAPLKRGPVDLLAEKATELGTARLQPVMTRFTTAARVNATRLRAHAVEAAEQCRRLTVPDVAEPMALAHIAEGWPADRRLFVLAEHGRAAPAATAFAAAADDGAPAALLVGPEGGFADSELDALAQLAFVTPVRLGPRVLRAETAALAGLALWQALAGDWR
jgi:16S rRNA (uracil1498-N3)-methyltransferase